MDFGRAFTFAFQDPDWLKKVGLAAVIFLIPIMTPLQKGCDKTHPNCTLLDSRIL